MGEKMSAWLKHCILEKYGDSKGEIDDLLVEEIDEFEEEFGSRAMAIGGRFERWSFERIIVTIEDKLEYLKETYGRGDDWVLTVERSRAITSFYKDLSRAQDYIEKNYRKELWVRGEYCRSKKWITGDPNILAALEKTKFFEVFHYIDTHNIDRESPRLPELSKGEMYHTTVQSGKNKGKDIEYEYAFILVNKKFYEKASQELGLSQISIQKYLQRFCEIGFMKKIIRTGKGGLEWLYADGYWVEFDRGIYRKIRFLKNSAEMRKALRGFRISS